MKTIAEKIQEMNAKKEAQGLETRYWIVDGNRYFVCHDACSTCEDIEEITFEELMRRYDALFHTDNAFKVIKIKKDCEICWYPEYGVDALNLDTLICECTSGIGANENLVICIAENLDVNHTIDEVDFSNDIRKLKSLGIKVVYALYNMNQQLCGFVYAEQ